MSEAELFEAIHARQASIRELNVIFLSLVSAYIVVAYSIGSRLTRSQVLFVSSLYVIWGVGNCLATLTSSHLVNSFWLELGSIDNAIVPPYRAAFVPTLLYVIFVNGGALVGSLWFMRSVRHGKSE